MMSTHGSREFSRATKTATAVGDPVLMRLATASGNVVLLAEELGYDKAGVMRLQQVRWVRGRRGVRAMFSLRREPAVGRRAELVLRKIGGKVLGQLPSEGWLQAPATRAGFVMVNLTVEQYRLYKAAAPRRLLVAGNELGPRNVRKARLTAALLVVHRVRQVLRQSLVLRAAGVKI